MTVGPAPASLVANDQARAALQATGLQTRCSCEVVELTIDGARSFVLFRLNIGEHRRRNQARSGAITDRGLLHALWSLPEDIPVPCEKLTTRDAATLQQSGRGHVIKRGGSLCRVFRPAGTIQAVVAVARSLGDAVGRVGQYPAIFERLAVSLTAQLRDEDIWAAQQLGVGIVTHAAPGHTEVVDTPAEARRGVPGVYRWWISELAYRNWGYANCAHWSS